MEKSPPKSSCPISTTHPTDCCLSRRRPYSHPTYPLEQLPRRHPVPLTRIDARETGKLLVKSGILGSFQKISPSGYAVRRGCEQILFAQLQRRLRLVTPTSTIKLKSLWLALISFLISAIPFLLHWTVFKSYLILCAMAYLFAAAIHAVIVITSLVALCLKGGISRPFLWISLILSSSYIIAFLYALEIFNFGPGP
jgi:hypothetical protein